MLYPNLIREIESLEPIPAERLAELAPLVDFLQTHLSQDDPEPIRLNFICTHNSRRSHLAQIWAQALAAYLNLPQLECYSGGTETTAVFPQILQTLQQQGFHIQALSEGQNPVYALRYDVLSPALVAFSKIYDNTFNPSEGFAAVMTCDSADAGCPFIAGALARIPMRYQDPKLSDNTPEMAATYLQTSRTIARDLLGVFRHAIR